MLRKVAIIGANGFVGRHLVEHAASQGVKVLGVVRSAHGAALVQSLGGRPLPVADLGRETRRALESELKACDGLVYTAPVSVSPLARDRTDPAGLLNVLEACRTAGVPRVVFFSGLGIAHFGMNPHCTSPYFLAKMAGEVALFRSGLAATVFRPSYIFGARDEFLTPLLARMSESTVIEIPGDGAYRIQPISVRDTARATLRALEPDEAPARVVDLVGPEIISYRDLIARMALAMRRPVEIRHRSVDEAFAQARASGYFGLRPQDLACLLCDEVADPTAARRLVEGTLESLDSVIAQAFETLAPSGAR
jgi:NADH dehydrogenase